MQITQDESMPSGATLKPKTPTFQPSFAESMMGHRISLGSPADATIDSAMWSNKKRSVVENGCLLYGNSSLKVGGQG